MKRLLLFLLLPVTVAVIVFCFIFPSSYFQRQDLRQLETEEEFLITEDDGASSELSILGRLEMLRNLDGYLVTDLPAADREADKVTEKTVTEIKKLTASVVSLYDFSYQSFLASTAGQPRHYTVSDLSGHSFTVWEIEFRFGEEVDTYYDGVYIKAVYDEQMDKLLQLLVSDDTMSFWEPDPLTFELIGKILGIYYGTEAEQEQTSEFSTAVTLKTEERSEDVPVYYSGDLFCLNIA